jgi:3,4-dihydroxy 2-butanone 4-phosphate synthase/GTP cyclohydrolase II
MTSVAELADHLRHRVDAPRPAAVATGTNATGTNATGTNATGTNATGTNATGTGGGTVTLVAETVLPSRHGSWTTRGFAGADGCEYVLLSQGDLAEVPAGPAPLVRLHSECLTGDALGSVRCDCGEQLDMAMRRISAEGVGAIVYVRGNEGRGIGLLPKLEAYALQDQGWDTVDANLALGYRSDARDYAGAARVLLAVGLRRVRLLTNNVEKVAGLGDHGIEVTQRIPLISTPSAANLRYLMTKQTRMGHQLHAPTERTNAG